MDDVMEFLQRTYEAAANLGRWDRVALEAPWADTITIDWMPRSG